MQELFYKINLVKYLHTLIVLLYFDLSKRARQPICRNQKLIIMKIIITLTEAEKKGIISYLKEVDEIDDKHSCKEIDFAIQAEIKQRLYHALRDPRESISSHINDVETSPVCD